MASGFERLTSEIANFVGQLFTQKPESVSNEPHLLQAEAKHGGGGIVTRIGGIRRHTDPELGDDLALRIYFSQANSNTGLLEFSGFCTTSVGNLPRYEIGTIWDGESKTAGFWDGATEESFDILRAAEHLTTLESFATREECEWIGIPLLRPRVEYAVPCELLETSHQGGTRRVLIPCHEILRAIVGSSDQLIRQILFGGLVTQDPELRTHVTEQTVWDAENRILTLMLGETTRPSDARAIARIFVDKHLSTSLHKVHLNLGVAKRPRNVRALPIELRFPNPVDARFTARGRWVNLRQGDPFFFVTRILTLGIRQEPFEIFYFKIDDGQTSVRNPENIAEGQLSHRWPRRYQAAPKVRLSSDTPADSNLPGCDIDHSDFVTDYGTDPDFECYRGQRGIGGEQKKTETPKEPEPLSEAAVGGNSPHGDKPKGRLRGKVSSTFKFDEVHVKTRSEDVFGHLVAALRKDGFHVEGGGKSAPFPFLRLPSEFVQRVEKERVSNPWFSIFNTNGTIRERYLFLASVAETAAENARMIYILDAEREANDLFKYHIFYKSGHGPLDQVQLNEEVQVAINNRFLRGKGAIAGVVLHRMVHFHWPFSKISPDGEPDGKAAERMERYCAFHVQKIRGCFPSLKVPPEASSNEDKDA